MKNFDVIKKFVDEAKRANGYSVFSTGDKLFSFNTIIAERINGIIYVNPTNYSLTTSKAQTYLRLYVKAYLGYECIETENNIPYDTNSLVEYIKE